MIHLFSFHNKSPSPLVLLVFSAFVLQSAALSSHEASGEVEPAVLVDKASHLYFSIETARHADQPLLHHHRHSQALHDHDDVLEQSRKFEEQFPTAEQSQ